MDYKDNRGDHKIKKKSLNYHRKKWLIFLLKPNELTRILNKYHHREVLSICQPKLLNRQLKLREVYHQKNLKIREEVLNY